LAWRCQLSCAARNSSAGTYFSRSSSTAAQLEQKHGAPLQDYLHAHGVRAYSNELAEVLPHADNVSLHLPSK
jgi:hypothetical protein